MKYITLLLKTILILLFLLGVVELVFVHKSLIEFPLGALYGKYPHVSYGHILFSIAFLIVLHYKILHKFVFYLKDIQDEENYSLSFIAFIESLILVVPIICVILSILFYAGLFDY